MASSPSDAENLGSDNRPHHPFGFSFAGTIEVCAAARRNTVAPKSLAAAGERGTELHEVLETAVKKWLENPSRDFTAVVTEQCHAAKLNVNDTRSVLKITQEITPYFIDDDEIQIGTEERIELLDPRDHDVTLSYGWYDILLVNPSARVALIVDHKFVRKEVALAEKNRQGHCLAVAVFQAYDVDRVEVLFSMPECKSSRYTFTRAEDFPRLEAELTEIYDSIELPYKTLRAGEHCIYCKFKGKCPATYGAIKTMATGIEPMSVPASFNPAAVTSAKDMALLRHWCAVIEPIIDQVKEEALKRVQAGEELIVEVNGERVKYALMQRDAGRKISKNPIEVWERVQTWMPMNAFLMACDVKISKFEDVAVEVLADRLIAENKKPNKSQLARSLNDMLVKEELLAPAPAKISYLKRVKVREEKTAIEAE